MSRVCCISKSLKSLCLTPEARTCLQGHRKQRVKLFINPFPTLYYLVMEFDLDKIQAFYF